MARKKKKNIILENILIEDYAAEGRSIARVEGKVIFVEQVVPGDVVDIRLGKNKKDWAEGHPIAFRSYSDERVTPFCSHFGVCGGCQWQMLPYHKQLQYKQQQVKDNLQRIGKIPLPDMQPILGAAKTQQYRNKIEYTFGTELFMPKEQFNALKEQGINPHEYGKQGVAGFHGKGFWDKIVDIRTCYLQEEPTNAIRLAVKAFAKEHGYSFYDLRQHTGFLRTMQVRLCETGELMVNLVMGEDDPEKREKVLEHLRTQFPRITTLLYTINTKRNDSLYDLEPVAWYGPGYVTEQLEQYRFKIGPRSFFQTNTTQAVELYRVTRDFAELSGKETLYDLYCGTGSIGIFCSEKAAKVIGVEVIDAAIEDAKENAALNDLDKTRFYAGDVIDICSDAFFEQHGRPDVIITDPPRAGMHEKLVQKINEMAAPIVVYVSCNPATQARDLALLNEKYEVTKIQPVDMFPHTLHIENVVQLKLRS
ncbi:23S rRNA (uracil(1939)-C(5))-methyltransferase RlmD [Niabella drilacis]|uniref:23S rRNA (Uracil1939-C5)-methyltransferase n=1 Tax=Niabella drilacis (strain DSM 25811 / CCM 8410 / CCUG 62505 / LMG 26954 / E90) TaxID=1285928 RepID=A0A1G6PFY3_NIADE|nr:23S rRNA (uracil(1939)-C(5))-methyltransferase RlmD [Niabella drilacis]SDC79140.1 23S rRNA (uracil1939-C5)-methyltransferase [Niabella drilacis]